MLVLVASRASLPDVVPGGDALFKLQPLVLDVAAELLRGWATHVRCSCEAAQGLATACGRNPLAMRIVARFIAAEHCSASVSIASPESETGLPAWCHALLPARLGAACGLPPRMMSAYLAGKCSAPQSIQGVTLALCNDASCLHKLSCCTISPMACVTWASVQLACLHFQTWTQVVQCAPYLRHSMLSNKAKKAWEDLRPFKQAHLLLLSTDWAVGSSREGRGGRPLQHFRGPHRHSEG